MDNRPRWLDTLRADEVTVARLRRAILDAAQPLLAGKRDSWWDVASNWATLLTPVAAVLTLIFAGLAVRQGVPTDSPPDTQWVSADVVESLRSQAAPAGFSQDFSDDASIVFAALSEADTPEFRPGHKADTTDVEH
ncbi:MAG: hypothetical protein E4H28_06065 [Gemmatimonadales bacterium]|nr:MAG: hypothetical protein E4H28_06065 [Gemmatimonadales bacterium]